MVSDIILLSCPHAIFRHDEGWFYYISCRCIVFNCACVFALAHMCLSVFPFLLFCDVAFALLMICNIRATGGLECDSSAQRYPCLFSLFFMVWPIVFKLPFRAVAFLGRR